MQQNRGLGKRQGTGGRKKEMNEKERKRGTRDRAEQRVEYAWGGGKLRQ